MINLKFKWGHMFHSGDAALQVVCDGCKSHCFQFWLIESSVANGHLSMVAAKPFISVVRKLNCFPLQRGNLLCNLRTIDWLPLTRFIAKKRGECWYSRRSHTPFLVGSIPILATNFLETSIVKLVSRWAVNPEFMGRSHVEVPILNHNFLTNGG
jgi:hypothetical protein